MAVTVQRLQTHCLVRIDGQATVASAAEIKEKLIEALAGGVDVQVDLREVGEMDASAMQLLWAAAREGDRVGVQVCGEGSEKVVQTLRQSGFGALAGFPIPL